MTEEEAKAKWCPFVRLTASQGEWHTNREGPASHLSEPGHALCIGSACMAWRHRDPQVEVRQTGLGRMPVEPYERFVAEGWRQIQRPPGEEGLFYERTISNGGGYCGLAGPLA
jgi:hypothetical protein